MSQISIRREHGLSPKAARAAADEMAGRLEEAFQLKSEWRGETLHFSRSGVQGTMTLERSALAIEAKLGLVLAMLKPRIEKAVHENLDKLLDAPAPAAKKAPPKKK